jgi:hypothetical protein
MLDLSAEAVVLRFPNQFDEEVLQAARVRLEADESKLSDLSTFGTDLRI